MVYGNLAKLAELEMVVVCIASARVGVSACPTIVIRAAGEVKPALMGSVYLLGNDLAGKDWSTGLTPIVKTGFGCCS